MRQVIYKYLIISCILVGTHAQAEEQHFTSVEQETVVIELYTSEGCNSCPPAEEYLNSLKHHPDLWRRYIPIAFHVDYWDYIGWRDPYAHPLYGKRQSAYARLHKTRTVYTPAFVVNGKMWRRGWFGKEPPTSSSLHGELTVTVDSEKLKAKYVPASPISESLTLNVAVLGMGLINKIMAGENEGRTARHEFVVVGFKSLNSADNHWMTNLPSPSYSSAKQHALVVWVSRKDDPTPLQAIGGELAVP